MKKIVAKLKNQSLIKGLTDDFSPHKKSFHVKVGYGKVESIDLEDLKAIFFVKNYEGNKDRKKQYKDLRPWEGIRIKVIFHDGEEIVGYTPHHALDKIGFFLTPADLKSNNEEIFVIISSTKDIIYL
jgi:hypothetical protein